MKHSTSAVERFSLYLTEKVGTPESVLVHTIFFVTMFLLPFFGVDFEHMMIMLTTVVSLEAIYLALFIQMTVNRTHEGLEDVEENIKDVAEDVIEIQEGEVEDDKHDKTVAQMLQAIEKKLNKLQADVDLLKK